MPTQMSASITSLPRVLTRAAALFRGSRAAPHTRRLHIYKCTYDEQKAAFEQGLAPPDEPFAVSAAAAAAAPNCYVLNHDRGIDESQDSYRQRSLEQLRSHVFTKPGQLYKLIDSCEFAMENKLMYFGHLCSFLLDPNSSSSDEDGGDRGTGTGGGGAQEPTLLAMSFRRDPRHPLPNAVAGTMNKGAPPHYRQCFGGLHTTVEEELGRFLLAPAVPGSERCTKNFGLFLSAWMPVLDEKTASRVRRSAAESARQGMAYGPLNGPQMSLSEAQTKLRALGVAKRIDWTLDNVFSVSSDEAFLKGVGLLAFGDHFRSHAAAALLECLNWPQQDAGPPPSAQRAAACRTLLGRIYADWGYAEHAREYGAGAGEMTREDIELITEFTPREWWR